MEMNQRIKERRLAMNYTQEELAEKLGLQKSAIAKYENGRVENIKRSIILKMATILECSPTYLMGWDENELSSPAAPSTLPPIMDFYNQLNDAGKAEATKYTKNLTFVPDYTETSLIDAIQNAPKTQEELEAMLINESIKHNAG